VINAGPYVDVDCYTFQWRDGGPVCDQCNKRWIIGLTTIRAGPYVDADCYTFQSSVLIVTE